MAQYKLSSLAVMLIGAFACRANYGLVGIEESQTQGPGGRAGGAESLGTGGVPGAGGSSVVSCSNMVAPQGVFVPTGRMTVPRKAHTATLLPNGKVLVAGGDSPTGSALASAELYDPNAGTFTATASMTVARDFHTATLLSSGMVLIAGGGILGAPASAELYDPGAGKFAATGAMTASRYSQTATLLGNGKVLIAGGGGLYPLASAELYDPSAGKFTATGAMTVSRSYHTATLLGDGKVLVAGGTRVSDKQGAAFVERHVASAELYDPTAGTFEATGTMTVPRSYHTATSLLDGEVLVAGDVVGGGYFSAELYDPTVGAFVATDNGTVQGVLQTATLLPGGMVLVAGGNNGSGLGGDLASAALYDPSPGAFAPTSSMSVARSGHTATLLCNGKVLIAGGDPSGTAELYE